MNKKEVEGIEKVIKEYLKKNLRIDLDIYLGDEKIQEVSLYEFDFRV